MKTKASKDIYSLGFPDNDYLNGFLQDLINIILINAGVRPACSFDNAQIYQEEEQSKYIQLLQSYVDTYYPSVTIKSTKNSGYIGSREKNPKLPKNSIEFGRFVGYPEECIKQWNKLTDDSNEAPLTYDFSFIVKYDNLNVQPFAYRCLTDNVKSVAEETIRKMRDVLKKDPKRRENELT